jgi:hypothetical protein
MIDSNCTGCGFGGASFNPRSVQDKPGLRCGHSLRLEVATLSNRTKESDASNLPGVW